MRRDDLLDMLNRIPPGDLTVTVLFLRSGMVTLDAIIRAEPEYLVIRGREGGTTDEGRAFFIPYTEVVYLKLDRVVKSAEVNAFYETEPPAAVGEKPAVAAAQDPIAAQDPAAIAKQNLLDRIRAARTGGAAPAAAPPNRPR